ncbi:MAG: hypothetical protein R3A79_13925 [Nannocystaceae bacterium]
MTRRRRLVALAVVALAGLSLSVSGGADVEACSCSSPHAGARSPLVSGARVPVDAQPWLLVTSCASDPPCGLLTAESGVEVRVPGETDCVLTLARIIPEEPLTPGATYISDCNPYASRGEDSTGRADSLSVRGDATPSLPPLTIASASARVERIDSCCGGDAQLTIDVDFAEDDAIVAGFFAESGIIEAEYASSGRRFIIPAAPDEPQFWRRDRGTGDVSDLTLTPISASGERGAPLTIDGDSIPVDAAYIACTIGQERSPLLLLVVFAVAWRRRRSGTGP